LALKQRGLFKCGLDKLYESLTFWSAWIFTESSFLFSEITGEIKEHFVVSPIEI